MLGEYCADPPDLHCAFLAAPVNNACDRCRSHFHATAAAAAAIRDLPVQQDNYREGQREAGCGRGRQQIAFWQTGGGIVLFPREKRGQWPCRLSAMVINGSWEYQA